MKIADIKIQKDYRHGFGKGAKPGFRGVVTLQYGERSYETFDVALETDALREIVALAAAKAMAQITIDTNSIDVEGAPGEPEVEEVAPTLPDCPVGEDAPEVAL